MGRINSGILAASEEINYNNNSNTIVLTYTNYFLEVLDWSAGLENGPRMIQG